MRTATQLRHKRIQEAHIWLSRYGLSHELCLQIICEFFGISDHKHISSILKKTLEEVPDYPHQDLDNQWLEARVKKHMDTIRNN